MEKMIKINELKNYTLHEYVAGFGLCGYGYEEGGYVYAGFGHGNMEAYVSIPKLLNMLQQDGHDLSQEIQIELENDNIVHCHFYL